MSLLTFAVDGLEPGSVVAVDISFCLQLPGLGS
jgi:hypothetical protein